MWFNFLILQKIASQLSLSFIFISSLVQIFRNSVYAALLLYFTTALFTLMLYFNMTGVCNCSFPGATSEIWTVVEDLMRNKIESCIIGLLDLFEEIFFFF